MTSHADRVFALLPDAQDLEGVAPAELTAYTPIGIATALGCVPAHAARSLRRLRETKRAHIYKWVPSNLDDPDHIRGPAVWVRGPGEDAPRPTWTREQRLANQVKYNRRANDAKREGGELESNLLQKRELARSLATVERTKTAPRQWHTDLYEFKKVAS